MRKENQDTALVLAGRHTASSAPFMAAILCDGMGGLEHGDDAADLAAAVVGATLSCEEPLAPLVRMKEAISRSNAAVFERFRGRAGTVLVAALFEREQHVIGWVGDARIYGVTRHGDIEQLTRDDTIATEIARIEGASPDAMDSLLRAVGQAPNIEPHVELLKSGFHMLLLVSDGIHRVEPAVLRWVSRHAHSSTELAERLVAASLWEGGLDNATGLAVELDREPILDEEGELLAAWAEAQPRVWQAVRAETRTERRPGPQVRAGTSPTTPRQTREGVKAPVRARATDRSSQKSDAPKVRPPQVPLNIEVDSVPKRGS